MAHSEADILEQHGIQPSAQRVAVARYVLRTADHPSADEVWRRVRADFPQISRATAYNSLKLFVEEGLLRQFSMAEGHSVYDPNVADHHHLIDEETGEIHDVPWESVRIERVPKVKGYDVREYQVIMRGVKRRR